MVEKCLIITIGDNLRHEHDDDTNWPPFKQVRGLQAVVTVVVEVVCTVVVSHMPHKTGQ